MKKLILGLLFSTSAFAQINITGINPPQFNDPNYVQKIINSFTAVDQHDHSSGKGLAVARLANNAVTSASITDLSVIESKIGNGAVTEGKLADGAVTTDKIADLNVSEAKIDSGAVTTNKLGSLAVTNDKIANSTIAPGKIDTSTAFPVKGSATNDSASAGFVGEAVRSFPAGASVAASGQYGDQTSISLTAGDWDVSAVGQFLANGATVTQALIGISSTSGNSSSGLNAGDNLVSCPIPSASTDAGCSIANFRVSLSGTTTYYLKRAAVYSVATPNFVGRISARRVR